MSDNENLQLKANNQTTTTLLQPQPFHVTLPPPKPSLALANPGPLGLLSFASTTLILSLYNVNARHIATPNVVVGMAVFCGGLAQLLAGMWEFPQGNMFGATAFSSYGALWLSFAAILIPGSGVGAAFAGKPDELRDAIGIYLITWFIVTFIFFIVALRKSVALIFLFGFTSITLVLLASAHFVNSVRITRVGGLAGIGIALIAYYIALAELLRGEKRQIFNLPLGVFNADEH